VPSVDWKHYQVSDQFRSRGASEFPAADEPAEGAEHLGVENRGDLKDRVVSGKPRRMNAMASARRPGVNIHVGATACL
jgi:hypothetical protein